MDAKKRGRRIANLASFIPRGLCLRHVQRNSNCFCRNLFQSAGVAVSVTCCELLELPPPPPHATIPKARHAANPSNNSQRLRRPAKTSPIAPNGSSVANRRPGFIRLPTVMVFPAGILTVTVAVSWRSTANGHSGRGTCRSASRPEWSAKSCRSVCRRTSQLYGSSKAARWGQCNREGRRRALSDRQGRGRWGKTKIGRRGCAAASAGNQRRARASK